MAKKFVMVHGAFQDASAWSDIVDRLRAEGHQAVVVNLPGRDALGVDLRAISLADYAAAAIDTLRSLGGSVTLVGHSFGGFTISSIAEIAPDLVSSLVYVAAYVPAQGDSLQSLSAGDKDSKFTQENFVLAPDYSYAEVLERDRALIFANDVAGELRESVVRSLRREPLLPMSNQIALTEARFGRVRKAFIRTLRDNAISPGYQEIMAQRAGITTLLALDSGHAASLTHPEELVRALVAVA